MCQPASHWDHVTLTLAMGSLISSTGDGIWTFAKEGEKNPVAVLVDSPGVNDRGVS